jgi:thiol-disulfide isomerase/thioredoxin
MSPDPNVSPDASTPAPPATPGPEPTGAASSTGRSVAWIALAIALMMLFWPLIRAELPPPGDLPAAETQFGYPEWSGRVDGAADLRGRSGPAVVVDHWITEAPELADRVVVIDFWATWCPPCVASIPHLDELVDRFGDRAAFIALSNEPAAQFAAGLEDIGRTPADFGAALALDPAGRMAGAAGLRGIPHILVMSRDGIVRWQGHPRDLDAGTLAAIIDADARAAAGIRVGGDEGPDARAVG